MFCRNCGNEISNEASVCVNCGVAKGKGSSFCPNCGQPTGANQSVCTNCGVALNTVPTGAEQKSKLVEGLLGIFLGAFGVHNFYLGYTTKAVLQLVLTIVGIVTSFCFIGIFIVIPVAIWSLIEAIMILCGSIKVDGKGVPLGD